MCGANSAEESDTEEWSVAFLNEEWKHFECKQNDPDDRSTTTNLYKKTYTYCRRFRIGCQLRQLIFTFIYFSSNITANKRARDTEEEVKNSSNINR